MYWGPAQYRYNTQQKILKSNCDIENAIFPLKTTWGVIFTIASKVNIIPIGLILFHSIQTQFLGILPLWPNNIFKNFILKVEIVALSKTKYAEMGEEIQDLEILEFYLGVENIVRNQIPAECEAL